MLNIDKALLDPAGFFSHPEAVLNEHHLSKKEKIEILTRWEYDARELSVAEEENMVGGPPNMLAEVLATLNRLNVKRSTDLSPPTKQGGS